jgi:hypothetical protein
MPSGGKPNNMGRSSGKLSASQAKLHHPPKGQSWTWLTRDFLNSHAWRGLSINAYRLMSFLLVEQCNHAGKGNGHLMATHKQLISYGMTAGKIHEAIKECVDVNLIEHWRGGRWAGSNQPSRFRLTFYACGNEAPTNGWTLIRPKTKREFKGELRNQNQKAAS